LLLQIKTRSLPPTHDIVTPIGIIYKSGGNTRSEKLTAVASDNKISYADKAVKYELNVKK
jgi:hypothetical protein